jgi:hypothetical protein
MHPGDNTVASFLGIFLLMETWSVILVTLTVSHWVACVAAIVGRYSGLKQAGMLQLSIAVLPTHSSPQMQNAKSLTSFR